MNRIVKQHFPAEKLPAELREGLDPKGKVTVTVVEEEPQERPDAASLPDRPLTLEEIFNYPGIRSRSMEEIDRDIRKLRDEWDE